MVKSRITEVCFRNDDVNELTEELTELTNLFTCRGIPITHAVEPGNLTTETINWLKQTIKDYPELIEIVQHGWKHSQYVKGEFDRTRSYEEQFETLQRGKKKLEEIFEEYFFPLITIPFGVYTHDTIKAADALKFRVFCSHYNYRISRRLFYLVGHILGKGQLLGRHISNHLKYYPGTRLFEIDTAISFIKKYQVHNTNICEMFSTKYFLNTFNTFQEYTPVIILLLHHRFHHKKENMELVAKVLDNLQQRTDVTFTNYENLYRKYSKA